MQMLRIMFLFLQKTENTIIINTTTSEILLSYHTDFCMSFWEGKHFIGENIIGGNVYNSCGYVLLQLLISYFFKDKNRRYIYKYYIFIFTATKFLCLFVKIRTYMEQKAVILENRETSVLSRLIL